MQSFFPPSSESAIFVYDLDFFVFVFISNIIVYQNTDAGIYRQLQSAVEE